ncbi:MAG: hypothetical protein ACI8XV_001845, partial [Arenicella sp.]
TKRIYFTPVVGWFKQLKPLKCGDFSVNKLIKLIYHIYAGYKRLLLDTLSRLLSSTDAVDLS